VQKTLGIDKTLSYLRVNIRDQVKVGKGFKLENTLLDIEINKKPTEFDAYFDGIGICYTQYESVAGKKNLVIPMIIISVKLLNMPEQWVSFSTHYGINCCQLFQ
jgi:hypothetical protein